FTNHSLSYFYTLSLHDALPIFMKHSYLSILKVSIGKVYIRMLKSYGAYFFQFPHSSKSMMLFDRKTKQSPKNNRTHKSCIDPDFSHSYLAPLLQIYKIIRANS